MGSPGPITFCIFLFLFQAASAVDPNQNFASMVGSFVDFPVAISKGVNYTDIFLRSITLREGLVLWVPGETLKVISPKYAGRVTLQNSNTIRIHNLTMEDGGIYETETQIVGNPKKFERYTLFVFNISTTVQRWTNNSCSVNMLCDVGTGKVSQVMYTWKKKESGITLSQNSRLHVVMNPGDDSESYSCTVQAHGVQSAVDFAPYKFCGEPLSGAAGHVSGLPSHYLVAIAILAPAAVALLRML